MKTRFLIFRIFCLLIFFSCSQKPDYSSFAGTAQGTTYSIVFENTGKIDPLVLKADVEKILRDFDMSLSLYKDSSILSKINRNEEAVPDKFFTEVFNRSVDVFRLTNGAFDITVCPLVRAWGFGPDEHKNISPEKIDSLLDLVGM